MQNNRTQNSYKIQNNKFFKKQLQMKTNIKIQIK